MMEIKVDVHAVHPSPAEQVENPPVPKKSCGSWCTPDSTPAHIPLTQTNSNIETKTELQEHAQNLERIVNQQHVVRLFTPTPPPGDKLEKVITEADTELKEFKQSITEDNSPEPPPDPVEKVVSTIEVPQSPVPASPTHPIKFDGFSKILAYCDPYMPIDPQGRGYISWLFLVTFCYSYNAWGVALRATFPYQTPENTPYWMVADYLCDIVYIVDLVCVKPRLMFLHEGFWVDEPGLTKRNYRRKLQYKFDVISLLPLDILYIYFGTQKVILRIPRVLKLQTFWEFHQAMDRVLASPYVVRVGKTLFYIFYLIHLNACAYYSVSDYIGLGSNGWVYDNQGNAYIRCFYFATKTATSIGKNPKPENTIEYLFMTCAWLMGVFVFALLIGQIRDIIATATMATTEYRKTVDGSSRYLRRLNMPTPLQRHVVSWFNYTWSKQRCFDESGLLNALPFNMKRDVALEVHMRTLSKVQLFRDCSDSLLRDLVLQLRPVCFLPGDLVVRRGDVGHQMYIITSGECYVMSLDEKEVLAVLHEGSVFGEISLLGIEGLRRRTATVRARGYACLFALSRNNLEAALQHHKKAAHVLRIRADQIIRENAARQTKQRFGRTEAKKTVTIQENETKPTPTSFTFNISNVPVERKQRRSCSILSGRRLSAVSESGDPEFGQKMGEVIESMTVSCVLERSPPPKIDLPEKE